MGVIECDVDQARERLIDAGAEIRPGNTQHELWRAEYAGTITVAYDGKVVVQGGDDALVEAVLRDGNGRAHVYFDGACLGNPGPSAIGYVIVTDRGIVAEGAERIGNATNNQAEYEALIKAVSVADAYGFTVLHIRGDSELVIKQIRGEYAVDDPTLREYRVTAMELLETFDEWEITHVPRSVNDRADDLATEALDEQ